MNYLKNISKKIFGISLLFLPGIALADTTDITHLTGYNIFTPPITDKSLSYLGQIFGTVGNVIHGTSGQLLSKLFEVFNYAMVIVAACILIYTVIVSVVNTANEGEFLGKNTKSAWIILRAVLGIGILVPKYTGYSLIQVFIMWVVVQGIGLADKAWSQAVDYLVDEGGVVYAEPGQTLEKGGMVNTFNVNKSILNSEICMYKLQALAEQDKADAAKKLLSDPNNPTLIAQAGKIIPEYKPIWDDQAQTVSFGFPSSTPDTLSACGQYSYAKTSDEADYFVQYKKAGLQQTVMDMMAGAKTVAQYSTQSLNDAQLEILKNRVLSGVLGATADYENIMTPALQRTSSDDQDNWKEHLKDAKDKGWILVGAYYWDLAKVNNKLQDNIKDYQATMNWGVTQDKLDKNGVDGKAVMDTLTFAQQHVNLDDTQRLLQILEDQVGTSMTAENRAAVTQFMSSLTSPDPTVRERAIDQLQQLGQQLKQDSDSDMSKVFSGTSIAATVGTLGATGAGLYAVGMASPGVSVVLMSLWASLSALVGTWYGVMNSPGDPIVMITQLGNGMLIIAVSMWVVGSALLGAMTAIMSVMGSATGLAYGIQNGLKLFVPIVIGFIGVLFVNGMVLGTYVPMIPFMIFTFAAIGWLIAVLEAIVAGPLIAAAIAHPEGHDLLGQAQQTVQVLMGVFLRPVVMVIGFLAAMIICRVALRVVNAGFSHAVDTSMITLSGVNLFGVAGVMIMYTMIVISIINLVFTAGVVKLWETIWMWIGFHQPSSSTEQAMSEVKSGLHGGAQVMGDTAGGLPKAGAEARSQQIQTGFDNMNRSEGQEAPGGINFGRGDSAGAVPRGGSALGSETGLGSRGSSAEARTPGGQALGPYDGVD